VTLSVIGEMEEQSLLRKSTTLDAWYILYIFGKLGSFSLRVDSAFALLDIE
jgi:hypothetical protein